MDYGGFLQALRLLTSAIRYQIRSCPLDDPLLTPMLASSSE
jgi:hypothetical protein